MEPDDIDPIILFMNVSWIDLNNVQEAGEYPFRDGTITVTFAEVALQVSARDAHAFACSSF
jgi:hypothetical protein